LKKNNSYNLYKRVLLFVLLLCSGVSISQTDIYSELYIDIQEENTLKKMYQNGIAIDHLKVIDQHTIAIIVSSSEKEIINTLSIDYSVHVPNYQLHYMQQKEAQINNGIPQRNSFVANSFDLGSMGGFYTFSEVEDKLDEMHQLYPDLVTKKSSIGTTVEGYEIWMVKISDNPTIDEEEPVAYYDALHHAREPLAMATTINYMFWLLENYEINPEVKFLVDHRELYFVPVVNPDGYVYNEQTNPDGGGLWRKNRNPVSPDCFGVDLNRNYGFEFANNDDCSSPNPCSNIYRGEAPFSEVESASVRDLLATISPNTAFSTHSTAGTYLMPYGFDTMPPDFPIYSEWASEFLDDNNYTYGVTFQMLGYTSCGTTRDYMHSESIYGWTPEIDGSGFWPLESEIFDLVSENIKPFLYQSWIAGAYVDIQSHKQLTPAVLDDWFDLSVEVKNVGIGAIAEDVTVIVEASSPLITTPTAMSYGALNARERKTNTVSPISIFVPSSFTDPYFNLTITAYREGIQQDSITIPIIIGEKQQLFFDDAELGDGQWSASGNGVQWGVVTDDSYSGIQCFGDSNGGNGLNNTLNAFTLISPLNFSEIDFPRVQFIAKHAIEEGDSVLFQISTNNGTSWNTLKEYNGNEAWNFEDFNLVDYAGESSILFQFVMQTNGFIPADGFYFDDFEVAGYSSSFLDNPDVVLQSSITVAPNPFNNHINLKATTSVLETINSIELYDVTGKKIAINVQRNTNEIAVKTVNLVSRGVYFLRIVSENSNVVQKLVKL